VLTTVTRVLGHLPTAWRDYFSVRPMGTLLPMCLVAAVIADLLLALALAMVELGWMSLQDQIS